jgi:hypothetical protein
VADNGRDNYECDALVVGSGAAGMSAAVTAGHRGLNVLIVEKEPRFGGTTARSGGWLWIPGTSLARGWGIVESPDQARTYLRHEAGNSFDAARVDAFLTEGPEAAPVKPGITTQIMATESCMGCHSSAGIVTAFNPQQPNTSKKTAGQLSADFSWLLSQKAQWAPGP